MPLILPLLSPKNKSLIVTMTLLLTLTGCAGGGGWQMPPPVVDVVPASQQDWTVEYQASGTLEANNKVDLNSEIAGTITLIRMNEGDAVRAGQVTLPFFIFRLWYKPSNQASGE